MNIKRREIISTYEILEQYKNGRRDFSNINCNGGLLTDQSLSGIIFRNAEMEGIIFNGSNLNNSDFSGAKLSFCGLRLTKLKNAKFVGCRLYFGSFQLAEFENTDLRDADISNWNFEGTERFKANLDGASLHKIWWSYSDMTMIDIEEIISTVKSAGLPMDSLLFLLERFEKMRQEKSETLSVSDSKPKQTYEVPAKLIEPTKEGSYGSKGKYGGSSGGEYTKEMEYGMQKTKTLKEILKERAGHSE